MIASRPTRTSAYFYSRPCGRGDQRQAVCQHTARISTHAPAGGATQQQRLHLSCARISTHAPAGGATKSVGARIYVDIRFLLTPLREGRQRSRSTSARISWRFLLTPLREGRPDGQRGQARISADFYSRPCGRGDDPSLRSGASRDDFYSRPCGRGDELCADERSAGICDFYSRPCGRGDDLHDEGVRRLCHFYSRPCGRGDRLFVCFYNGRRRFLLTPLREGRRACVSCPQPSPMDFDSRPCGRGDVFACEVFLNHAYFYSRPCGRGDARLLCDLDVRAVEISTHAPAGGATLIIACAAGADLFLLTPLREGRRGKQTNDGYLPAYFYSRPCGRGDLRGRYLRAPAFPDFYSRPCGRGDSQLRSWERPRDRFLLTPLREGRPPDQGYYGLSGVFLLTPLREGRLPRRVRRNHAARFLLTPLREGRPRYHKISYWLDQFLLTPLREGRPVFPRLTEAGVENISTHAPAGGATAIFHKSVMRFCGKLPKDDTVLCLASFGFPRRDPKAVYLAWISCANLPQKCVREGLALKDQGTSCFHEGLASHAFDPVLV